MTEPFEQIAELIDRARQRGASEPEAMALATASATGAPSVRVVLCRGIDGRGLRFFTNYESRKGGELDANPRAAVVFFWPEIQVQARVEGEVARLSAAESDAYFENRPRRHRLSAHVSAQSRPIESIEALREHARRIAATYDGRPVPRPAYWGGYRLQPNAFELWSRGDDRLHERVRFERTAGGGWSRRLLAP